MPRLRLTALSLLALAVGISLSSRLVFAQIIGADPAACRGASSVCTQHMSTYSFVSLTEGNVAETFSTARVMSTFGPTLMFDLIYNSYNADGTRASLDTGIGFGCTHTYNDFLFTQGNDVFRWGRDGRVIKFTFSNGTYQAAPGYFETLVQNNDGSFTITTKHQTKFHYQVVPGPHFHSTHAPFNGSVFRLTSIADRNNNITTLTYSGGNLTTVTDTFGRSLTLTYNGSNHLTGVTDPVGRVTSFGYDNTGTLLTTITDALGKMTVYTYNNFNQLTAKTDRDGRQFTIAYKFNLPFSEVDAKGATVYSLSNTSNWATDPNQLNQNYLRVYIPSTTSRKDGGGNTWQYAYDSNGFPLTITAPDGTTTTYTYDPNALEVASKTDANGHTTLDQYDSEGNLVQLTDANGNITKFAYEPVFNQMTSMTDPNGRTTSYTYDSHGNRLSETDPLGHTAQFTYDANGNVLTATDKRGNTTTYLYDSGGNRIQATDALAEVTKYTYDGVGNRTSTTDPNGHITSDQYDSLNRLTLETDALNGTKQTVHDGEGDKIKVVDQDGNATGYSYDLRRRMISTTDALNKQTTYTHDGNNNLALMTDRNGHKTTYTYDVQNRLVSTTDALGDVVSSTYDGAGNRVSDTDANGHTSTYLYDALNRKTQKSDALNEITKWGYDLNNLPGCPQCTGPTLGSNKITKQTDCNGKVIYWAFDGLDHLAVELHKQGATDYVITPNDAVTRYAYDENSNQVSMTDPVGNATTYSYDAVNRQDQMVNAAGDTWLTAFDSKGNVKTVTEPDLNVNTDRYDALDRLIQIDDEVGRVANFTYDSAGHQLTNKDGNGNGTSSIYDADYRVISVADALGQKTRYTFDAEGNLLTTTDRLGSVTTNAYDNINRRTSTTGALGNVTVYAYDAVDNLIRTTDANGNATTDTFDAVNRLVKETYADGTMLSYTYDCTGHVKTRTDQNGQVTSYAYNDLYQLLQRTYPVSPPDNFKYDFLGRMLTAEKGGWVDTFTWDGRDFLTQTTQSDQTVYYGYDVPHRIRVVTFAGRNIREFRDPRERLSIVEDDSNVIAEYQYSLGNLVLSRAYGNGVTATPTYNANNWVTSLANSSGDTRVASFLDKYSNVGTKLSEQKLPDSSPARSEVYGYNSIYQMIDYKAAIPASSNKLPNNKESTETKFKLDRLGNFEVKTTDGVSERRTHNNVNEITTINDAPLRYDRNGNLTDDLKYQYTYDEKNNLTEVRTKSLPHTVLAQFLYNAEGLRVEKIGSPSTTRYFYDRRRLIEEQDVLGRTKATYVYGTRIDELLTRDTGEFFSRYFYTQNALGSVVAVTGEGAEVLERYTYGPYGKPDVTDGNGVPVPPNSSGTPHSAIGNEWMFTGRQLDEETGLFFYRTRYLDNDKGRFTSRDKIGMWGDPGNLGSGYAYVGNNPTRWTDPYGTLPFWSCGYNCGCWYGSAILWCGAGVVRILAEDFGLFEGYLSDNCTEAWNGLCRPGNHCFDNLVVEPVGPVGPVVGPGNIGPSLWSLALPLASTAWAGNSDPLRCQWTPMVPGCPLHICTEIPEAPQCVGMLNLNVANFNVAPSPEPNPEPNYCLRHPESPGCLDFPSGPEPLPYFLMRSFGGLRTGGSGPVFTGGPAPALMKMGGSSSYYDPCGPWGSPVTCAHSRIPEMEGALW